MALANISNPLGGGAGATTGIIAGGVLYGLNGQTITGNASGAWAVSGNGTGDVTLTAGSSGASLTLGQGANGTVTLTPKGTGYAQVSNANPRFSWTGTSREYFWQVVDADNRFRLYDQTAALERMAVTSTGNLLIGGTTDITGSGGLKVFGTTAATSTTTGALQVAGGVGVAGAGYFGGNLLIGGATDISGVRAQVVGGSLNVFDDSNSGILRLLRDQQTTRGKLQFGRNNSGTPQIVAEMSAVSDSASVNNGVLSLSTTNSSGVLTEAVRVTNTQALVVTGNHEIGGNLTVSGISIESTDARSGAGAISVTATTTRLTTTAADALTLADGTAGQIKRIVMVADGGDGTLTPTTKTGFTTITFNDVGDAVTLQFFTTLGWMIVSNYGCTVA